MSLVRLSANGARLSRRLHELLDGADPASVPRVQHAVEDAWLLGCLGLSGIEASWDSVVASRVDQSGPAGPLRRARAAVPPGAPLSVEALLHWHRAATGTDVGLRREDRVREGGPETAPPALLRGRLDLLVDWLAADSGRQLKPAEVGALVLARLVELLPFADGNGRVARLASAHAVTRAGGRLPILVGADRPRLESSLQAAFRLDTAPLTGLLEEASERALSVMVQTLEGRA